MRAVVWEPLTVGVAVALLFALLGRELGNWLVEHELEQKLAIPGSPGYTTFTGPKGKPMAVGRPWGTPCQPVVFEVASDVPSLIYGEIQVVVDQARADGLNIALENRQFFWQPAQLYPKGLTNAEVKFVPVFANATATPRLAGGHSEDIRLGWDARLSTDEKHEVLTSLQGIMYLRNLGGNQVEYRRVMRDLIAFSQGVGASTAPGSGISDASKVDSFSWADLGAMQRMSGCNFDSGGNYLGHIKSS